MLVKDIDNLAKFLLDTMEGAVYHHVKLITNLYLFKYTKPQPKAIVMVQKY